MLSEYTTYEKEFVSNGREKQVQVQLQTQVNEWIVHFELELHTGKIVPFTCSKTNTMAGLYRQAQRALSPVQVEMRTLFSVDNMANPEHDDIPPPSGSSIRELFILQENATDILQFPKVFVTVEQFIQENKILFDRSVRTDQLDPLKPFVYRIYVIDEDYMAKRRFAIEAKKTQSTKKRTFLSRCSAWI